MLAEVEGLIQASLYIPLAVFIVALQFFVDPIIKLGKFRLDFDRSGD